MVEYDGYKVSGIYQITNLVNGKFYIGSAKYVKSRLSCHLNDLRDGKHDNEYLQYSFIKYGEKAFEFKLIEKCEFDKLIEREQYWLDKTKCYERHIGYNIRTIANSNLGIKRIIKHTEESKRKIGLKHKGKIVSDETRKRMSAWQIGNVPVKAIEAAKIVNRNINKYPHADGHKCKCRQCLDHKNETTKRYRERKRAMLGRSQ